MNRFSLWNPLMPVLSVRQAVVWDDPPSPSGGNDDPPSPSPSPSPAPFDINDPSTWQPVDNSDVFNDDVLNNTEPTWSYPESDEPNYNASSEVTADSWNFNFDDEPSPSPSPTPAPNPSASDETNVAGASNTSLGSNSLVTGEATGDSNTVFDTATDNSAEWNGGVVDTSSKDADLGVGATNTGITYSGSDDAVVGGLSNNVTITQAPNTDDDDNPWSSSDETGGGSMGAVDIGNAISSGGTGSLVSGSANESSQGIIATANANAGGANDGETEMSSEKASSDVLALSESTGLSVASINAIAALDAYDLVDGQLVLVRDPTKVWDGNKLVDNPNYSNEVEANTTMTDGVGTLGGNDTSGGTVDGGSGTGITDTSSLAGVAEASGTTVNALTGEAEVATGDASVNTELVDGAVLALDDQLIEDMATGQMLDQDGNPANGVYGGVEYVNGVPIVTDGGISSDGSAAIQANTNSDPIFNEVTGLMENPDGTPFTGTATDGQRYINGARAQATDSTVEIVDVDRTAPDLSIGETGLDGVTPEDILNAVTGKGTVYREYDIDGDGDVDSADALALQQILEANSSTDNNTVEGGNSLTEGGANNTDPRDTAYAALSDADKALVDNGTLVWNPETGTFDTTESNASNATGYMFNDGYLFLDGEPFTGEYNGAVYENGVLVEDSGGNGGVENPTGPYLQDGIMMGVDGTPFTGTIGDETYENGVLVQTGGGNEAGGNSGPTLDANGLMMNADGTPFTGELDGKTYVDGVEVTGGGDNGGGDNGGDNTLTGGDGTDTTETGDGTDTTINVDAGAQTINVTIDGQVVTGTVDADGNVLDADGNIIGTWDSATQTFTRADGITTSAGLQGVTITMNDGSTLNGFIDADGNVVDANGNVLGTLNENGEFVPTGTSATEGGSTGTVTGTDNDGMYIQDGVIYNPDGTIAGYTDGYQSSTEELVDNLSSATGNSTASYEGLSRAEIVALVQEMMDSYNTNNYDPLTFLNAFGFAMDPTYAGGVIPGMFQGQGSGVYMRRLVKDRDTGEYRYVDVPLGGMYTQNASARMQRRQGFGEIMNF